MRDSVQSLSHTPKDAIRVSVTAEDCFARGRGRRSGCKTTYLRKPLDDAQVRGGFFSTHGGNYGLEIRQHRRDVFFGGFPQLGVIHFDIIMDQNIA